MTRHASFLFAAALLPGCFDTLPDVYRVTGTVAGMWDGAAITLELTADSLEAPVRLTVDANGAFAFDEVVDDGAAFTLAVTETPTAHTCEVDGASGSIAGGDVAVTVTCAGPAVEMALTAPIDFAFDPGVTDYHLPVSVVVQETRLIVTSEDATRITINEVLFDSGNPTPREPLEVGTNTFQVRIEAGEAARTYAIDVDRGAGTIEQFLYAKAENAGLGDYFGQSIAIDGDTMVVGAPREDSSNGSPDDNGASNSGAVYVFRRVGSSWTQTGFLKASNIRADDAFGTSVAVSGNRIVVGSPAEDSGTSGIDPVDDDSNSGVGAIYTYVWDGTAWVSESFIKPSNPATGAGFGGVVAIDGDTIVVGSAAIFAFPGVYVFTHGATWSQQRLIAAPADSSDRFGSALDIDGDRLVIGAPEEDGCSIGINGIESSNDCPASGAAYIYERTGTAWAKVAYVKASNTDPDDEFGSAVAVEDDLVVVGAVGEDSSNPANPNDNSDPESGAAYVFVRSGGAWGQSGYLKGTAASGRFGQTVGVADEVLAVASSNRVTLFRPDPSWTEVLDMTGTSAGDRFGAALALSIDTVVVGAPEEDSDTTGINPVDDMTAPSENEIGAAYAFR